MLIPLATGAFVVGLLTLFFHRSLHINLGEAIFAGVLGAGLLGALIASAIYLGQLF